MREKEYDVPVIAPESMPLVKLTYHTVPDSNPDSVNVTLYFDTVTLTAVNVTDFEILIPLTVTDPLDGDTVYPDTVPIVYEYVSFGSENVMVFVVEDSVVPLRVTDHDVPDGRPVSVNVTE